MSIKKLLLAGLFAGSIFGKVYSQSIEKHFSTNEFPNTVRVSKYKQFGKKLDNFSFVDFSKDDYFARTRTKQKMVGQLSARLETKHGNNFLDKASLGVNYNLQVVGADVNTYVLPTWFNKEGFIDESTIAGVSLSKGFEYSLFGKDMKANMFAFGEYNIPNHQWNYGEIELYTSGKESNLELGLGFKLTNNSHKMPKLNPQLMLKYSF